MTLPKSWGKTADLGEIGIKSCFKGSIKCFFLSPKSMPGQFERFITKRINIYRFFFYVSQPGMLQHAFNYSINPFAVMINFF